MKKVLKGIGSIFGLSVVIFAMFLFGNVFLGNGDAHEIKQDSKIHSLELKAVGIPATRSGVTDVNGAYSVVFQNPYGSAPNVQASITNQANANQSIRVTSVTASGFTINVYQRNVVTLLGVEVLLGAVVPVSGATIDMLVTAKE